MKTIIKISLFLIVAWTTISAITYTPPSFDSVINFRYMDCYEIHAVMVDPPYGLSADDKLDALISIDGSFISMNIPFERYTSSNSERRALFIKDYFQTPEPHKIKWHSLSGFGYKSNEMPLKFQLDCSGMEIDNIYFPVVEQK